MTEQKLLDSTLNLLGREGTLKAYEYLMSNLDADSEWSSQVYNFLYCMAASSGKTEETLSWMVEAIMDKGLWYRPEVFEDSDLDSIKDEAQFALCKAVSLKKYTDALQSAKTEFSWKKKTKEHLLVVLHGNQQNNDISRMYWDRLDLAGYQIEYLQSRELDSVGLYRWEEDGDGPRQLSSALDSIDAEYKEVVLAGFSAGCNTILRALASKLIAPDKILLLAPWIPVLEVSAVEVFEQLKHAGTEALLLCGKLDEDCLPHCALFEDKAREMGFACEVKYIEGLSHEYPDDFPAFIKKYV